MLTPNVLYGMLATDIKPMLDGRTKIELKTWAPQGGPIQNDVLYAPAGSPLPSILADGQPHIIGEDDKGTIYEQHPLL